MIRRLSKFLVEVLNPKPTLIDSILCNRDEDIEFAIKNGVNMNYCNVYDERSFVYGLMTAIYYEKYKVTKLMLKSGACPNFPYSQSSLYHQYLLFSDPKKLVTNFKFEDIRKLNFGNFRTITSTVVAFMIGNAELLKCCLEYGGELSSYFTGFVTSPNLKNGEEEEEEVSFFENVGSSTGAGTDLSSLSFLGYFLTVYRPQNEGNYLDTAKVLIEFHQFRLTSQERDDFSRIFHSYYINLNSRNKNNNDNENRNEKSRINLDIELTFRLLIDFGFSIYDFSNDHNSQPPFFSPSSPQSNFWGDYDDEEDDDDDDNDDFEEEEEGDTDDQLEEAFRRYQNIENQRRHSDAGLHLLSKSYFQLLPNKEEEEVELEIEVNNDEGPEFYNKHERFLQSRNNMTRRNSTGSLDFPISSCRFSPKEIREAERKDHEQKQQKKLYSLTNSRERIERKNRTMNRRRSKRTRRRRRRRRRRKSVSLLKEVLIRRTRRSMTLASSRSRFLRSLSSSISSNNNNNRITTPDTSPEKKSSALPPSTPCRHRRSFNNRRHHHQRTHPKEMPIRWEPNKEHKLESPRTPVPVFMSGHPLPPQQQFPTTTKMKEDDVRNNNNNSDTDSCEETSDVENGLKKRRSSIVSNESFYLKSISRRRKLSDRYRKRKRSTSTSPIIMDNNNSNNINNSQRIEDTVTHTAASSSNEEEDKEKEKEEDPRNHKNKKKKKRGSRRVKRNRGSPESNKKNQGGGGGESTSGGLSLSLSSSDDSTSTSSTSSSSCMSD